MFLLKNLRNGKSQCDLKPSISQTKLLPPFPQATALVWSQRTRHQHKCRHVRALLGDSLVKDKWKRGNGRENIQNDTGKGKKQSKENFRLNAILRIILSHRSASAESHLSQDWLALAHELMLSPQPGAAWASVSFLCTWQWIEILSYHSCTRLREAHFHVTKITPIFCHDEFHYRLHSSPRSQLIRLRFVSRSAHLVPSTDDLHLHFTCCFRFK